MLFQSVVGFMSFPCFCLRRLWADYRNKKACRVVFISPSIGTRSLQEHIENLRQKDKSAPVLDNLQHVISLEHDIYSKFTSKENTELVGDALCKRVESAVRPESVLNLQFTSGMFIINHAKFRGIADCIPIIFRNHRLSQGCHVDAYVGDQGLPFWQPQNFYNGQH